MVLNVSKKLVRYYLDIAEILGSSDAASYFDQLTYEQKYSSAAWFPVSVQRMRNIRGLSRFRQEKAKELLIEKGWIATRIDLKKGKQTYFKLLITVNS